MFFYQGLKLVNIFGSLVDILACSWQILAVSLCFLSVLLYYWPFCRIFKAIFGLFIPIYRSIVLNQQSIQSSLFPQIYSKCRFRHFACLYIYIFMFHPHFACSSRRDHDNDQGDQNWSWYRSRMVSFGISCCIRYYIDKFWLFLGHFWVDIRYVWWTSGCQQQ